MFYCMFYFTCDRSFIADARERGLCAPCRESRAAAYSSLTELFAAIGSGLWNSLPSDLGDADLSYSRFRRSLKTFYRAMHFSANARSWDRMASVCPSVCLSVTLVICDHIGWKSRKLTIQTILAQHLRSLQPKGDPPSPRGTWGNLGETRGGVGKKWRSGEQKRQYLGNA